MVKRLLLFLLLATTCFGQQYTLRDQAFLAAVQPVPVTYTNITNGLIAYWKMDEGSGLTAFDSSGNGLNGNLRSMHMWNNTDGKPHATCIGFPVGGYDIESPADPLFWFRSNNQWSIGWWSSHTNASFGNEGVLYTATRTFRIGIDNYYSVRKMWLFANGLATSFGGPTPSELGVNNWMFHVITRNGSQFTWYTNGNVCSSEAVAGSPYNESTPAFMVIGWDPYETPRNWKGLIEEMRIHNGYCLSSNEVQYLYHNYYGQ